MKKLVLAAAAAATLALIVPASAQSVTIGVNSGMHRDRDMHSNGAVVVHEGRGFRSRAEYRPHRKVVIIRHHRGWDRPHHGRTVVIER